MSSYSTFFLRNVIIADQTDVIDLLIFSLENKQIQSFQIDKIDKL